MDTKGVDPQVGRAEPRRRSSRSSATRTGLDEHEAEHMLDARPHGVVYGLTRGQGRDAARPARTPPAPRPRSSRSKTYNWPKPYDTQTNPLSIDLTAANTFILICSSVTMVLALAAIQRDDRAQGHALPAGHRPDRLAAS